MQAVRAQVVSIEARDAAPLSEPTVPLLLLGQGKKAKGDEVRKTGLKRTTPLRANPQSAIDMRERAQAKARAKALTTKRKRIKSKSDRQKVRDAAYYASKPMEPQPCVRCGVPTTHEHHPAGREKVRDCDRLLEDRIPMCDGCNLWCHEHPIAARAMGWMKSRHTSAQKASELKEERDNHGIGTS